MIKWKRLIIGVFSSILISSNLVFPAVELRDEGVVKTKNAARIDCVGSSIVCSGNGINGVITVSGGGTGDVVGPASATDNALVRFDATTGKLIQNSGAILDDSNNVTGVATLNTGQGANELYDMDQNVLTTSDVTFNSLATTLGVTGSTITSQASADPKLTYDVVTSGDTDFYTGVNDDGGGDDDDSFEIRTNATAGSNVVYSYNKGTTLHTLTGNAIIPAQGEFRLADSDSSNYVGFKSGSTVASNLIWTLPTSDSSGTQCIASNGSGTLSWSACSGGSSSPGGLDTYVQFNDSSTFGGDSGFIYNKTTDSATLTGDLTLNGHDLVMGTSAAGVTLTDDGDGALTFAAKGDGSQENLTMNLDDTSNQAVFSSSTGLNQITLSASDATAMSLAIPSDAWLIFGIAGLNTMMDWETTGNDNFQVGVRVNGASTSGFYSLMERADMGDADRSPAVTSTRNGLGYSADPVLRIYSSDDTNANDYIEFYHNQTDAVIDAGQGVVHIYPELDLGLAGTDGALKIYSEDGATDHFTLFQPGTQTQDITYTLPPDDGSASQLLQTDGSGVLSWVTVSGSGDSVLIDGVGVSDGSGVDLIGGTNGIDIAFNAGASPDTATFNLDLSEISAGDLADASVVENDLAASLAFDDGDFLDLSSINASSTTEGIKLPQNTSCTSATAEGQVCWDTDGDDLYIGDGTTAQQMNGTGGSGAKIIPLPIMQAKITGAYVTATITGVDVSTQGAQIDGGDGNWRLLFDATTDESAVWQVIVPDNYTSTPVIKIQYSMTSATTNEVEWEGAVMCVTPGDAADVGTASFASASTAVETVPGTVGHTDSLVSITPTDDSCAAGDLMYVYISTDADDATNDDATGDRELVGAYVSYT